MVEVLSRDMRRLVDRLSREYPKEWTEFMQTFGRADSFTFPDGTRIDRVKEKS
jgi:hypothetical protein